jgi:hypothetical protein
MEGGGKRNRIVILTIPVGHGVEVAAENHHWRATRTCERVINVLDGVEYLNDSLEGGGEEEEEGARVRAADEYLLSVSFACRRLGGLQMSSPHDNRRSGKGLCAQPTKIRLSAP